MKTCFLRNFCRITVVLTVALVSFYAFKVREHAPARPVPLPDAEYRFISPLTYNYIHDQPRACANRSVLLVLLVPAAPHQYAARRAVRNTWGAPGADTVTLFFLGLPEDASKRAEIQQEVDRESESHGDIVQLNFTDSYRNLTVKTLMMLRWLHARCPHARYGMKADADVFVNTPRLRKHLARCPRTGFITGSVIADGAPRRGRDSKWRVSVREYGEDTFPPYVSGAGYVFSWDLAGRISWASRFVRAVPLEDVYVGLCLRVLRVRPVYAWSLVPPAWSLFEVRNLRYDRCRFRSLILVNGFGPEQLEAAWQDFTRGHAEC